MNARDKFFIILGVILAIALGYYLISTPRGSDLDLIGIVDANQVIVSPQVQGRISKLLVDEGTAVKQRDLIACLILRNWRPRPARLRPRSTVCGLRFRRPKPPAWLRKDPLPAVSPTARRGFNQRGRS